MARLFDRSLQLIIDGKLLPAALRVSFSIRKTLSPSIDTATISVWGLSDISRGLLSRGGSKRVTLLAGYGNVFSNIYTGTTVTVENERQGTETITTLNCGDGAEARKIVANDSYAAGVRTVDVIRALVATLLPAGVLPGNLEQQIALGTFADSELVTFQFGYATSGQVIEALNVILRAYDVRWTIQEGQITIIPENGVIPGPVFLLNELSGLIGSPQATEKGGATATSLLQPKIKPGSAISIVGRDLQIGGRCDIVQHEGDNFSGPWYTNIEVADLLRLDEFDKDPLLL